MEPRPATSEHISRRVIDLRIRQPATATVYGSVPLFPLVFILEPVIWLGRRLLRKPAWELVIAESDQERIKLFHRLRQGRALRDSIVADGGSLALNRKAWTPTLIMLRIAGIALIGSGAKPVIEFGTSLVAAGVVAVLTTLWSWTVLQRVKRQSRLDRNEVALAVTSMIQGIAAMALSILSKDGLPSGAILILVSAGMTSKAMRVIVAVRCQGVIRNPRQLVSLRI